MIESTHMWEYIKDFAGWGFVGIAMFLLLKRSVAQNEALIKANDALIKANAALVNVQEYFENHNAIIDIHHQNQSKLLDRIEQLLEKLLDKIDS